VHFRVPCNYHGAIVVCQDDAGTDIYLDHGIFNISVPVSGIVRIPSLEPLQRTHEELWSIGDGVPARTVCYGADQQTRSQVLLRYIDTEYTYRETRVLRALYWYGTADEADACYAAVHRDSRYGNWTIDDVPTGAPGNQTRGN
jgi:hypothetical protein